MNKKKLIKKFKEEFLLSNKYEYELGKDECGKTLEILLPREHAKKVRKRIPRWYNKYRTIIKFKTIRKKEDDEDDEEES